MKRQAKILIPTALCSDLRTHIFRGTTEQGGFLFADLNQARGQVVLLATASYLVPRSGWERQTGYHLSLRDEERLKVMLMARERDSHLVEFHSHRGMGPAGFSISDTAGLAEVLRYVKWKLPGKMYGAIVWSHMQVAGAVWTSPPDGAIPISDVVQVDASGNLKPLRFADSRTLESYVRGRGYRR